MTYQIFYHPLVVKEDIPRLDEKTKNIVKKAIEQKLMTRPEIFGIPLRNPLDGYRKLRVGDWRIIFEIKKDKVWVLVIKHRSKAYKNFQRVVSI